MIQPKNRLFCRLDGMSSTSREQKRVSNLKKLGLLESETIAVFEEAIQTAASFLETPIGILGLRVEDKIWFKSATGLSCIGLMNQLATYRKIPVAESFSTYVIDSQQNLIIDDALTERVFAQSALVQHYGIRAYLGTPLLTAEGECLGTLEVMDTLPRNFSRKDVDFLALTARWCMREYERNYLLKEQSQAKRGNSDRAFWQQSHLGWESSLNNSNETLESFASREIKASNSSLSSSSSNSTNNIKIKLLENLIQELKTPLTSVIGMASVLGREFYGPLTSKQKEYVEIIHNSGQSLITLVDEIVNLGVLQESNPELEITSVDIEMLCQQIVNSLNDFAKQRQQELRLSVEPGNRIWLLDKEKSRQALYYLVMSVLESSEAGGELRIHVSRRHNHLNIAVWISHPWLGEGLPQVEVYSSSVANALTLEQDSWGVVQHRIEEPLLGDRILTSAALMSVLEQTQTEVTPKEQKDKSPRENLGLLLTCHLVELHGGQVIIQGSADGGYRYLMKLPKINADNV